MAKKTTIFDPTYTYEQSLRDANLGTNRVGTDIMSGLSDMGLGASASLYGTLYDRYNLQSMGQKFFTNSNITNAVKNGLLMSPAEMQNAILNQELSLDAYNKTQSFQAQVDQMEDAGLNKALMYGFSGGVGSSGGADSASVDTGSAVNNDSPMAKLSTIVGTLFDTINMVQGVRRANADIENVEADTESKKIDNAAKPDLNRLNIEGMTYDNAAKQFNITRSYWDSINTMYQAKMSEIDSGVRQQLNDVEMQRIQAMTKYYNAVSDKERREIRHIGFNEWIALNELRLKKTQLGQDILLSQARIINLGHQNDLFDSQAMNAEQSAIESSERSAKIRKETDGFEQSMFIDYITAASAFTNAYTGAVGMSLSVGKKGLSASGYNSKKELRDNLTGTVFQSIQDLYGDSGFYHRSQGKWFTLTPDVLISKNGIMDYQDYLNNGYRWDSTTNTWRKTQYTDRKPRIKE